MPRTPTEPDSSSQSEQDYESTFLPATPVDLDQEAVQAYLARRAAELGRVGLSGAASAEENEGDLERKLAALGLGAQQGGTWRPTVAALLLFGRNPELLIPQAQVKLARFRGDDVAGLIIDRAELGGAAAPLIEGVVQFVSRNMHVAGPIEGVYRRDTPEYPIRAVREAISNAVAHRDYRLAGQKVQIRMFDDRLEIESPGGLAGPVTLDTLESRRYSRNPRLAQNMYVLGLVEEMGTGIRRIRHELAQLGSGVPAFRADRFSFMITLPAGHMAADAPAPVAEQAQPQDEETRKRRAAWLRAGLSPRQVAALEYARENGRITNREFRDLHPDISDEAARLDLAALVEHGALIKFGSNRGTYYVLRD